MNIDAPLLLTLYEAGLVIVCLLSETRLRQWGRVGRSAHWGAGLFSALFTLSEKSGEWEGERVERRQELRHALCQVR